MKGRKEVGVENCREGRGRGGEIQGGREVGEITDREGKQRK